jgi:putative membrane protein
MKRTMHQTVFPLMLFAMIEMAYGQVREPGAPRGPADRPAIGSATTPTADASIDPVNQAIEMSNAEIALARIASERAQHPKVKSFAEMLVKDHTAVLTKLRAVPGVTTVDIKPSARHQANAERLSKISGSEFDREYMRAVVSNHQEALKFFEQQTKADDPAAPVPGKATLAKVSQETIPTVREHLQVAQSLLKDLEVKLNLNPLRTPNGPR